MKSEAFYRQSNIELLRMIAMMGVIMLHYNGYIGHASEYANSGTNLAISSIGIGTFICTTNVYMLISGYFLVQKEKISLKKPILLMLQNSILRLLLYIYKLYSKNELFSVSQAISYMLGTSYFIILYACTYILSPFINILIRDLNQFGRKCLLVTIVGMFSIYPFSLDIAQYFLRQDFTNWSPVGALGSQNGYTITVFLMMYIVGAVISVDKYDVNKSGIWYICSVVLLSIMWYIQCSYQLQISLLTYYNPFVVVSAIFLFMAFKNVKVSFIRGGINKLSRASLTILLVHGVFIERLNIEKYAMGTPLLFAFHMVISCLVIYFLPYPVHLVYDYVINRKLNKLLDNFQFLIIKMDFLQ